MSTASTSEARKILLSLLEDSIAAGEREALEQEFFEKDDLFEELLAAEDELVDELVSGRLSTEMKAILEHRPVLVPGLKARTALSYKLSQLAIEKGAVEFRRTKEVAPCPRPRYRFRSWLAVAALLVLAAGPWLWWRSSKIVAPNVDSDTHITWVLSASSTRGTALPQLRISPSSSGAVTLILELEQSLHGTPGLLSGTITDGQGTVRELGSELRIETFPWGTGVEVAMPTEAWQQGLQTLELNMVRTDGTVETIATYQFELLHD